MITTFDEWIEAIRQAGKDDEDDPEGEETPDPETITEALSLARSAYQLSPEMPLPRNVYAGCRTIRMEWHYLQRQVRLVVSPPDAPFQTYIYWSTEGKDAGQSCDYQVSAVSLATWLNWLINGSNGS